MAGKDKAAKVTLTLFEKAKAKAEKAKAAVKAAEKKASEAVGVKVSKPGSYPAGTMQKRGRRVLGAGTAGTAAIIGGGTALAPKSKTQMEKDQEMISGIGAKAAKDSAKKKSQTSKDQDMISGIAAKAAKDSKKKKTTTTKKDDGKKTFRERRLARMKKRLEGSENEGRKRRLTRRIGRVEDRIEDSKKKPVKKMGGGMMKSKMASKGGKMGGKMPRGYKDGDEVRKSGSVGVGKNNKKDEPRTGGQGGKVVPRDKKGLAKLPKKIRNKMGYMKAGGMAKKGYSKGGAVKRGKPRGVGAALRGYGKALR